MLLGVTELDVATAIVASYAALVATLALGFQMYSWAQGWRTRLKVDLQRMEITARGVSPPEPVILFGITNHSGHRVKVTHVSLAPLRKGGQHLFIPHPLPLPQPGPFEIPPRDSINVWIEPNSLGDYDERWKTRALIASSDKRGFKSKRVLVRDLVSD